MANYRDKGKVDDWLTEDGLLLLESYSRDGMVMSDIADKIGVAKATLVYWCQNYPEIGHAVSQGRELVDYKVENALLKSALGYTTRESKVVMELRAGKLIETKRETTIKEIQPNVAAIVMWLNNRKPTQWKRNRDNVLQTDDKDNNIVVNIYHNGKKAKKEQEAEEDWDDDDDWDVDVEKPEDKAKLVKQSLDMDEQWPEHSNQAIDTSDWNVDEEGEW